MTKSILGNIGVAWLKHRVSPRREEAGTEVKVRTWVQDWRRDYREPLLGKVCFPSLLSQLLVLHNQACLSTSYTTHSGLDPPSSVSNRTNSYKILQNSTAMLTGQPDGGYSSVEIYFSPGVSRFITN